MPHIVIVYSPFKILFGIGLLYDSDDDFFSDAALAIYFLCWHIEISWVEPLS